MIPTGPPGSSSPAARTASCRGFRYGRPSPAATKSLRSRTRRIFRRRASFRSSSTQGSFVTRARPSRTGPATPNAAARAARRSPPRKSSTISSSPGYPALGYLRSRRILSADRATSTVAMAVLVPPMSPARTSTTQAINVLEIAAWVVSRAERGRRPTPREAERSEGPGSRSSPHPGEPRAVAPRGAGREQVKPTKKKRPGVGVELRAKKAPGRGGAARGAKGGGEAFESSPGVDSKGPAIRLFLLSYLF